MSESQNSPVECPICSREFTASEIEEHVNRCLFLSTSSSNPSPVSSRKSPATSTKRQGSIFASPVEKKQKTGISKLTSKFQNEKRNQTQGDVDEKAVPSLTSTTPLAEVMRPASLETYVGQSHVLSEDQVLRRLLDAGEVPSLILWGPPGCGKTSLANVIAATCKRRADMRFVKLSATTAGIADVKEVVAQARSDLAYKRKTILFVDEIHRFNKLQQDVFLPHVESGTVTLLGATTENPSFSLTGALLSRCRVVQLNKLSADDVELILERALQHGGLDAVLVDDDDVLQLIGNKVCVGRACVRWLAECCDGDARQALCGLQLAVQAAPRPASLSLDNMREGLKRCHTLYSRAGDEHYDTISALHKSVRASDDNAALYWLARMLRGGEDPLYIARRLVRAAAEDIGLADNTALPLAVSCLHGCQQIGSPECDVLLAQCVVHLARAPKSQEVYRALGRAQAHVRDHRGPLPPVPLHLRNAPTKLMKQMGCGAGYNTRHKDESGLTYLPDGLAHLQFFSDT